MNNTLIDIKNKLGSRPEETMAELPEMASYRHITAIKCKPMY